MPCRAERMTSIANSATLPHSRSVTSRRGIACARGRHRTVVAHACGCGNPAGSQKATLHVPGRRTPAHTNRMPRGGVVHLHPPCRRCTRPPMICAVPPNGKQIILPSPVSAREPSKGDGKHEKKNRQARARPATALAHNRMDTSRSTQALSTARYAHQSTMDRFRPLLLYIN